MAGISENFVDLRALVDERAQECPSDAARSRADCAASGERADVEGRRRSRRRLPADGSQMGGRYRREGLAGLRDRSSRPHRLRQPTWQGVVEQIEALRRQRRTGKQIAAELHISPATVRASSGHRERERNACEKNRGDCVRFRVRCGRI